MLNQNSMIPGPPKEPVTTKVRVLSAMFVAGKVCAVGDTAVMTRADAQLLAGIDRVKIL